MGQWDRQAGELNKEKKHLLEKLGGRAGRSNGHSFRDSVTDLSFAGNHPADLGSESFERSKDLALKEHHLIQYRLVEDALERIENGTYGICRACGGSIDQERLETIPEAPLCIACREFAEKIYDDSAGRPAEEGRLLPPFAQKIVSTSPGFDMEDFWQEVSRHNKRRRIFEDSLEDEETGLVEGTDSVSNEQWRDQLPD